MLVVKYSDDETEIKSYHAANIIKPSRGDAKVILTNKRVIIAYETSDSSLTSDVDIDEVRGSDISWTTKSKSTLKGICITVIGLILLISGISMVNGYFRSEYGISLIIFGLLLLALGVYFIRIKKTLFIIIFYTKSLTANLAIHNVPSSLMSQGLNQSKITIDGEPGPDAKTMAKEIGVIIQDIQKANRKKEV